MDDEFVELPPALYLRNLADRIFRIPAMHGVDQYDYERLREIAQDMEAKRDTSDR